MGLILGGPEDLVSSYGVEQSVDYRGLGVDVVLLRSSSW